jgi:hypothetical protein
MVGKIIISTGYYATGKTVFSQKLPKNSNFLCFNKDFITAVPGRNLDINSLGEKHGLV